MNVLLIAVAVLSALAESRSAMSDDYWAIWNDAEQARIDADIEANRKADVSAAVDALEIVGTLQV